MNVRRVSFPILLGAAMVIAGCHSNSTDQADNQNSEGDLMTGGGFLYYFVRRIEFVL